ncbi:MAG: PAAR domain-containing protein [Pseudomonadota bacterium]|jgi:uncharacterized Zn-binding protein involved in type VI secretion
MPAAHRHRDLCSGHGCWPPRPNAQASTDVRINGRGAHRVGDAWEVHCCPAIPECHGSVQAGGSPTVYVNGQALARVGDAVACGSACASGSADVFADDATG